LEKFLAMSLLSELKFMQKVSLQEERRQRLEQEEIEFLRLSDEIDFDLRHTMDEDEEEDVDVSSDDVSEVVDDQ
jgi:hypothetical protein